MMVPRQLKTAQSRPKSAQHGPRTAKDRPKTAPDKGAQLLSFSLLSCLWFLLALSAWRSSLVTIIPATLRSQGMLREYSSCVCNAGAICISPTVCNPSFSGQPSVLCVQPRNCAKMKRWTSSSHTCPIQSRTVLVV